MRYRTPSNQKYHSSPTSSSLDNFLYKKQVDSVLLKSTPSTKHYSPLIKAPKYQNKSPKYFLTPSKSSMTSFKPQRSSNYWINKCSYKSLNSK